MIGNANTRMVTIGFPSGEYGKEEDQIPVVSTALAASYRVPPIVWMVVFLAIGYFGIRWVMED
jgi:hypothetical protein